MNVALPLFAECSASREKRDPQGKGISMHTKTSSTSSANVAALKQLALSQGLQWCSEGLRPAVAEPLRTTLDRYLVDRARAASFKDMRSQCYRFQKFFGGDRTSIDAELLEAYIRKRLDVDQVKPSSINRELTTLRAALKYSPAPAAAPELVPRLPDDSDPRIVLLDAKELRRLLDVGDPLRSWIILAIITGARKNELERATEKAGSLVLPSSKGGLPRVFRLPAFLVGKVHKLGKFPKVAWREHRRRRGFPDLTWHDLRHVCASILVNEGFSLEHVAAHLGHKCEATTKRYAHLKAESALERLQTLEKVILEGINYQEELDFEKVDTETV